MPTWDERFRAGDYPTAPDPSPVLLEYIDAIPNGRALDVAAGTGRNAVALADRGYTVEAVDRSQVGLTITRERAADRGIAHRIEPIQADLTTFRFPTARYHLITNSFYRAVDRIPDLAAALVSGGYLFVEHHLRSTEPTPSGPSDERYRFAANELLRTSLGLTVVYYDETSQETDDGNRRATARVLARKTTGPRQTYPPRPC